MAGQAPHSVEVWKLDAFFAVLATFPPAQQKRITDFMAGHLSERPKVMVPGQLKELKGAWSGVYQLDCGKGRRLLYEVDDGARKVRIIYLGEHPEWDKRHKMQR